MSAPTATSAAPGSPTRAASFRRRPAAALAMLAALGIVLSACGGGSGNASSTTTTSTTTPTPGSGGPPPGATGTVASVSGSTLEVQNPTTGQVTVDLTSSTVVTDTASVKAGALAVGECVAATGTPGATGHLTARTVSITPSTSGTCSAGAGFGGGAGFRRRTGGTTPTTRPGTPRFSAAFGKLTSLSGTVFVVQPATGNSTSVTTTSSTTYTQLKTESTSAIAVGDCLTAIGTTSDTGVVTARSVAIRPAGPSGCTSGFGGGFRGGFGGGTGGTATTGGSASD